MFVVVVVAVLFPFAWEIWWLQLHCSRLDFKRLHVHHIVSYVYVCMFIEKCLYFFTYVTFERFNYNNNFNVGILYVKILRLTTKNVRLSNSCFIRLCFVH